MASCVGQTLARAGRSELHLRLGDLRLASRQPGDTWQRAIKEAAQLGCPDAQPPDGSSKMPFSSPFPIH